MRKAILESKTSCKVHDPFWIDLVLDFAKPRQVRAKHVLERSAGKRVIRIHSRVRHVLPVRNRRIMRNLHTLAQHIGHLFVNRRVGPRGAEVSRDDRVVAVGWVSRVAPVREEAALKGFKC